MRGRGDDWIWHPQAVFGGWLLLMSLPWLCGCFPPASGRTLAELCRGCGCGRYVGVTEADYEWITGQLVEVANRWATGRDMAAASRCRRRCCCCYSCPTCHGRTEATASAALASSLRPPRMPLRWDPGAAAHTHTITPRALNGVCRCCGGRLVSVLEGGYNLRGGSVCSAFARRCAASRTAHASGPIP